MKTIVALIALGVLFLSSALAETGAARDSISKSFRAWVDGRVNLDFSEARESQSQVRKALLGNALIAAPWFYRGIEGKVSLGVRQSANLRATPNGSDRRNAFLDFAWDEYWIRFPFHLLDLPGALTAGSFRWKNNPQAMLAGEYLARYSAYPIRLVRDGRPWDPLDTLSAPMTGFQFTLGGAENTWTHQAELLLDSIAGQRAVSFAYSLGFKPSPKFDLGVTTEGYGLAEASPRHLDTPGLPASQGGAVLVDSGSVPDTNFFYYHFAPAYHLSLRGALNLSRTFFHDSDSGHAWTLFGEVALLGIENQPPAYAQRSDRVAATVGMHLPTLRILKSLCLQWERMPISEPLWSPVFYTRSISGIPGTVDLPRIVKAVHTFTLYGSLPIMRWLDVSGYVQSGNWESNEDAFSAVEYVFGHSYINYQIRLVGYFSFFRH